MSVVKVLAVDDQPVFRRVARQLVQSTDGFELVAEASSGEEALALASELRPDLVLLDVRMPGLDGIETARRLPAVAPGTVVVLISLERLADLPASMASAGAAAHVRKQELSPGRLRGLWHLHGRV
ncbi:MAG TPA: response regulator transcription factor [Baekduia sp.]|uniref:response regulator transcription factor n=1 Tax=Baekduia sp. TaxID=2600305 RepID=UPI002D76BEA2|nr:response regulator transcription factor [Baekduia sp.]HET6509170.1 response regulator transcription factor [Baekduia sp.]